MSRVLVAIIHVYQRFISPLFPPRCKYYPTCSEYAVEALRVHGAWRGLLLAGWRLLRCNPLSDGGLDPVPPKRA
jgi:hypothetical protein